LRYSSIVTVCSTSSSNTPSILSIKSENLKLYAFYLKLKQRKGDVNDSFLQKSVGFDLGKFMA